MILELCEPQLPYHQSAINLIESRSLLVKSPIFPWFSYGFPMVSYDFPMIFPWFSYGLPTFLALRHATPGGIGAVFGHAGPCGAAGASNGHGVRAPKTHRRIARCGLGGELDVDGP